MGRYLYQAILMPNDGGYDVRFPDLDGCFTCGNDMKDAINMAADAASTYVSALSRSGDPIPEPKVHKTCEDDISVWISFEAEPSFIVDGPVMSAAKAARMLGVSAGRVTHMIDAGILEGYRDGRHTWITQSSVEARIAQPRGAGRPKKAALV